MNSNLVDYYRERAKEYEKLYYKPERQDVLQQAADILQRILKGFDLLEIACGTGYWTEKLAATAKSIKATDINEAVLDIAQAKTYAPAPVCFECRDLYQADGGSYEGLFGGFIWSHIKLEELPAFISAVHKQVKDGGTVVFMDNIYVAGSNLPITRTDEHGNTYQTRTLENGTKYEVLKNFVSKDLLRKTIGPYAWEIEYFDLQYYWIIKYRIKAS